MKHYYFFLLLFFPWSIYAQSELEHPKKVYVDSAGRYYQQASLPIYFYISTSQNGQPIPLQTVSKEEVYLEGHGAHAFKHENFLTKKDEVIIIHADGIAPITTSSFLQAPTYSANNRKYYGIGLEVTLAQKDEMSGVDATYHSTNGSDFATHSDSPVAFASEGEYLYSYYSVDRTGNAEDIKTNRFTVDLTPPSAFHSFIGISSENVISTNSSIYLSISDTVSGVASTQYKFDDEKFRIYKGGNIAFKYLEDGYHKITYYSVDNVQNKGAEQSFEFYVDKTSPIMSADVLGDKFLVGKRVYFSGRTKLKITAIDNKSGIKRVMYTINDEEDTEYTEPFYLPNRSGVHNVKFYAIDNTDNPVRDDFEHTVGVIYVDLTGPALEHSYDGPNFIKADTVFISPATKVELKANDPEAGLKKITYSFANETNELPYLKSFNVADEGLHQLNYFGYDNVNNKNSKTTYFMVDTNGPEITIQFANAANDANKYPSYTTVYLAATDAEVGTEKISYSINGGKEQAYVAPLRGFEKDKEYKVAIKAYDLLGNESEIELVFETDTY
jgi:hypothetical protein